MSMTNENNFLTSYITHIPYTLSWQIFVLFKLHGLYSSLKSMKIFVDTIFLSTRLGTRKFGYLTPNISTKFFT